MYQLKSVSRNYKDDLTYMVGVLRPELVVEYIMEPKKYMVNNFKGNGTIEYKS